jgi:hypothetical protein
MTQAMAHPSGRTFLLIDNRRGKITRHSTGCTSSGPSLRTAFTRRLTG